jgi:hypothetical protein
LSNSANATASDGRHKPNAVNLTITQNVISDVGITALTPSRIAGVAQRGAKSTGSSEPLRFGRKP